MAVSGPPTELSEQVLGIFSKSASEGGRLIAERRSSCGLREWAKNACAVSAQGLVYGVEWHAIKYFCPASWGACRVCNCRLPAIVGLPCTHTSCIKCAQWHGRPGSACLAATSCTLICL